MQNKLRSICSFLALGFFLLIALATFSLELESTNETVAIKDCKSKPVVTGHVHVRVTSSNPGHYGMILLSQQKVKPDTTCEFNVITNKTITFNCVNGVFVYDDDAEWQHDNSEDLWRVEVAVRAGNDRFRREVQVQKYSTSSFSFDFTEPTHL